MKFNCGPTRAEREHLKEANALANRIKLFSEGEIVFAWRPIRISPNRCVWLEKIKRTLRGYRLADNVYGPDEKGSTYEPAKLAASESLRWSSAELVWVYEELS